MKPLHERLNERLAMPSPSWRKQFRSPLPEDPEVEELATLAQHLHETPDFQVDPNFARRLEQRVLLEAAQRHPKQLAPRPLRVQMVWAAIVLGLLLSMGTVLVLAAQVSSPSNPLYSLKQWEQHSFKQWVPPAQVSPTAPMRQQPAEANLQQARAQLDALASLADPAHTTAYNQALSALSQQIDTASQSISALPAGTERVQLTGELTALKSSARHTLRGLLSGLNLSERAATTGALKHLGETVPGLTRVLFVASGRPGVQALVTLTGTNLTPGAQLVVNGRVYSNVGTSQRDTYLFLIPWSSSQPPTTVALLSADGTVAETTTIIFNGQNPGNGPIPTVPPIIPSVIPTTTIPVPTMTPLRRH